MKALRRFAGTLLGLGAWFVATPAAAWVETHLVSDDVRVEVERSGSAIVEHALTMKVQGGPLRSIDLAIADEGATPLDDGTVISAQTEGNFLPVPLQITPRPDGALRINIEAPKGISRGTFVFRIRYRKNLLTGGHLQRNGAMLDLRWKGPSFQEGLDNARCTFVLPSAPTEPRPPGRDRADDDSDDPSGVFISEVKRKIDHDEVELIRPHVARSEAVVWSVKVDPRALGETNDPRLRPPPPPPPLPVTSPEERLAYLSGAAIVLVGFSLLVGCKARHVKKLASGLARPRPLLPIGTTLRTLLAGPALTAGIALQLHADDPWWGTLLVLLAMTLTWYLPPAWLRRPRGPGRWLPLADHEAFAHPTLPEFAWLDASTRRGALALSLSLLALGALAVIAARTSSYGAYLVAFDAAVLLPLFGTGRRAELPPHPFASAGPRLRRVAEHLRKNAALRAIAWGRLPEGQGEFDELRLLASPKVPRRGFTGIEVGYVAMSGVGGALLLPEVLVRVIDASPCHDAFRALVPGSHWMRGRKPDERVVLLKPRLPTLTMTAELAAKLARCATDTAAPTVASLAKTKGACSDEQQRIAKIGESRKSLGQVGREARAHFES